MKEEILKRIYEIFRGENGEIFLVGGSVRDMLMGKELIDLDFATSFLPEETSKILKKRGLKVYPVGWAFGTVGAIIDGTEIHITTYRKKEKYRMRSRKPVVEFGQTLNEDLIRRDFTINAMAISPEGKFIDLFGGKEDLSEGLIRTSSIPDESFQDDPLRILRAFRFQSQLGFRIEESTYEAIQNGAFRIMYLSEERIQQEMKKLLLGEWVAKALFSMMETRALNFFIPELYPLRNLHHEDEHQHKDVWRHTVKVVENAPRDEILRLAALLHDIAKPYTKVEDTNGVHFYRHEELGAKMAYSILGRLKFPLSEREDISFLIAKHMRSNLYISEWTDSAVRRFTREMGEYLEKVLALSQADITSYRKERVKEKIKLLNELGERIKALQSVKELKHPLSGNEIMEEFNLTPGPLIGRIKDALINEIIEGRLPENGEKEIYFSFIKDFLNKELEKPTD